MVARLVDHVVLALLRDRQGSVVEGAAVLGPYVETFTQLGLVATGLGAVLLLLRRPVQRLIETKGA